MSAWRQLLALAVLALFASAPVSAAPISLVGQLDPNNAQDAFLHVFTVSAPGTVTIQSWGYGGSAGGPGGRNAEGAVIAAGGFDPYVTVFSGSGPTATFLASNDDGSCPPGTIADALCADSTLTLLALPAGTYTLAVSAFLNMSLAENLGAGTLGDGFVGLGSFGTRTNAYAVDISGSTVVVPTRLLAWIPNGLTFGPQTLNVPSGPLVVNVTNVGTAGVSLGSLTIGGTNAAEFTPSTDCTGTLAPGLSCSIAVVFTPTAVGGRSATMTLASNASNDPIVIALGGTGTTDAVATASLSVTDLDFGTITPGSSKVKSLVVTNTGGAPLGIGADTLGGVNASEFSIASDGCGGQTVGVGLTCTIQVRFTPASLGPRSATLTIASNASNSPVTVLLTGNSVTPTPVPTLGGGAMAMLILVVGLCGMLLTRRRSTRSADRRYALHHSRRRR